MQIHECIRKLRMKNHETQSDIANLFQTTREQISKYETGKQELPTYRLIQLCLHWGISADYILGLPNNLTYPENDVCADSGGDGASTSPSPVSFPGPFGASRRRPLRFPCAAPIHMDRRRNGCGFYQVSAMGRFPLFFLVHP